MNQGREHTRDQYLVLPFEDGSIASNPTFPCSKQPKIRPQDVLLLRGLGLLAALEPPYTLRERRFARGKAGDQLEEQREREATLLQRSSLVSGRRWGRYDGQCRRTGGKEPFFVFKNSFQGND